MAQHLNKQKDLVQLVIMIQHMQQRRRMNMILIRRRVATTYYFDACLRSKARLTVPNLGGTLDRNN
jgi:hypothetical protein